MSGFDLLDAESGILASVSDPGAAVIFHRDETLGPVSTADADAATDLTSGVGRMRIGDRTLVFGTENTETGLRVSGDLIGTTEIELSTAKGGLTTSEGEAPLRCLALSDRVTEPAEPDLALTRSITIAFADGGLFALRAARPRKGKEQEAEETEAVFAGPSGVYRVGEPLLSTTYDSEGRPDRATFELWPEEDSERRLSRGGGTVLRSAVHEAEGTRRDIAFFRWSVDGRQGLGRYEISRAL